MIIGEKESNFDYFSGIYANLGSFLADLGSLLTISFKNHAEDSKKRAESPMKNKKACTGSRCYKV